MKSVAILAIVLGTLGYAGYQVSAGPCDRVLQYSIGNFSTEFGVSRENFKQKILAAEAVWEKELGKNLFEYKEGAKFTVNLIYDERQREVDRKQKTEFGLSAVEAEFRRQDVLFNASKSGYEAELLSHEQLVQRFQADSARYEAEVKKWNKQGGAPPSEYASLEAQRQSLNAQVAIINADVVRLNSLQKELNTLVAARNTAARAYNQLAESYNDKYSGGLEFDQAEYNGKAINVYEFKNSTDLITALSHEFGHALGMEHVDNQNSIMYYITSTGKNSPTQEDLAELTRACKSRFSF